MEMFYETLRIMDGMSVYYESNYDHKLSQNQQFYDPEHSYQFIIKTMDNNQIMRKKDLQKRITDYSSIQNNTNSDDIYSLYNTPKDLLRKSIFAQTYWKEKECD